MKASRFTEAQKAFVLKQGEDGTSVAEASRKAGISQATQFNWKKRYGGLLPDEMRRLKPLEDENGRLKKIVAEPAVWSVRHMATGAKGLRFVPPADIAGGFGPVPARPMTV